MEFLLDNDNADKQFKQIVSQIKRFKNGEVAAGMALHGMHYHVNWGVSLTSLKEIAAAFQPSHILALKLWNRSWRETMILATLLDEPDKVTEEQMDFWTKSVETSEIAEHLSANLWWRTPYAYAKSLEWCRGKKHLVRYTSVHLAGRLAMMDKHSPDEMFELFFEEFLTLSKDPSLLTVLYRTLIQMTGRSDEMREGVRDWCGLLRATGSEHSEKLASEVLKGLPPA